MKANLYSIVLMAGAMISSVNAFAQPTTSAPTPPELAKSKVVSIYSDAYASTGFEFGVWGSGTTYAPEKIGDTDNVAKFTTTDLGYFGWQFGKVNTAAMDKLHVDIYGDAAFSVRVVPITGGTEVGQTIEVSAGKWTSVDLDTKVFADGGANLANVYQIKFDNVKSQTFYIDNVYFWSTSTDVDTEAPTQLTATLVESAFTTVTLSCTAVDNSGAVEFVVTDEANPTARQLAACRAKPPRWFSTDLQPTPTTTSPSRHSTPKATSVPTSLQSPHRQTFCQSRQPKHRCQPRKCSQSSVMSILRSARSASADGDSRQQRHFATYRR